ncbi:MAG: enoyl-CoA hydratase/isomerase family protein [Chloroflexi bacterium]|nr:enoyl-CoA hydratase/isomerase family protein [Chloroflexota bacterium]
MNGFETIIYEKRGPIAWVTLNRPNVLNVYNTAMRDDLYQVLEAVRDDPEVQGAILCGAGERAFCAGADLTEFGTAPSQSIARRVRWQRDVWGLFLRMEKPMVAALHGYVLGSGVEMALLCDIRISSEDAVFGLPELALGMIPAAGATQTLPRVIGAGPALDILLTGRRFDAAEAYELGLVNRTVPRERLLDEAEAIMGRVLEQEPLAVRYAKRAVTQGMEMPLGRALELESRLAAQLLRRGVRRFGGL